MRENSYLLSVDDARKKREITNRVYVAHLMELEKDELQILSGHRRSASNRSCYSNRDLQISLQKRRPMNYDIFGGMSLNKATLLQYQDLD